MLQCHCEQTVPALRTRGPDALLPRGGALPALLVATFRTAARQLHLSGRGPAARQLRCIARRNARDCGLECSHLS